MRRLIAPFAAYVLLTGFALTQMPAQDAEANQKIDFTPARIVSTVEPIYPPNVLAWGTVVMEVTVDEKGGAPSEVKILSGLPGLAKEAERAVKDWKFAPARLNGAPVRTTVPVAITFSRGTFPPAP